MNFLYNKKGKVILVTGFSGAGKTTLVKAALENIPMLQYITTTTSRPPRPDEQKYSYEYDFVSLQRYHEFSKRSSCWINFENYGNLYGADLEHVNDSCEKGLNFILNIFPSKDIIYKIKSLITNECISLFINTSNKRSESQLLNRNDLSKSDRVIIDKSIYISELVTCFDKIFTPSMISLEHDKILFIDFIQQIIET